MWYRLKHYLLPVTVTAVVLGLLSAPIFVFDPVSRVVHGADRSEAIQTLKDFGDAFALVAEDASPAVVSIQVVREVAPAQMRGFPGDLFPEDLFEFFFGPRGFGRRRPDQRERAPRERQEPRRVPMGHGSGFVIDSSGYIVTNSHVIGEGDAVEISVTLADGREFEAELVGADPETDVALIKIDAEGLPTLTLGDSDAIKVGEWVLAIGNPFGLTHTVTAGIISARGRGDVRIVEYADFIQTDAAINPGNSGGPLINLDGEVIGMNTAIYSRTGGSMGIGFAIPTNMIRYVEQELREYGKVTRGQIGVVIQPMTADLAESFGIDTTDGILIGQIMPDSPAEEAGLERGDVILEFEGERIDDMSSFRWNVASTTPGTEVELLVLRDGQELTKTVVIGTRDPEALAAVDPGEERDPARIQRELGVTVQNLTEDIAGELGYEGEQGVVVTGVEPGSPAAMAGIRAGNLIQEVNREQIQDVDDFEEAVKDARERRSVLLLVYDGQYSRYVALRFRR